MPVYECTQNAENIIKISEESKQSLVFGLERTIERIITLCRDRQYSTVAFDGWYGINWTDIMQTAARITEKEGISLHTISATSFFKSREEISSYNQQYVTDDPGFGKVNRTGTIEDMIDEKKVAEYKELLGKSKEQGITIVYGCGSAIRDLRDTYDLKLYFDKTHQAVQWLMWDGKLMPFSCDKPIENYSWKEYNYSDYYLLDRHKSYMVDEMDYYVEALEDDNLKLIPRKAYDEIMSNLVQYPIKEVKIFSPGPWGAYRYRDLFEVEGLECNAWNKIAGPELRIIIDVGAEETISMSMLNIMNKHGEAFVGSYIHKKYPGLFPMDIWLDDGYHETPQPAERISMPMHLHPSSGYVERHFDEPLGRYETYYIAEAYEGANTWMGYMDDVDLELWEEKCRESNNLEEIEDWKDFICNWDSKEGDLYLIPPGTMHGHGGNQMVLEMDTNPSINGTEYSFFEYDFARNSWDDDTKTMTGKPLKMHLDHGFDMDKNRRETWVKDNLLAKPKVIKWTKEYYMEQFSSYPTMPYHVERFHFENVAENDTHGKFMHILTLTVGSKIKIQSKTNEELFAFSDKFQSIIIPASFGEYEIINLEGGRATVVQQRWKKG